MIPNDIKNLLNQYINGALKGAQKTDLEAIINQKPELLEELEMLKKEKMVENELIARSLRKKLQELDSRSEISVTPVHGSKMKIFFFIILTILLIIGLVFYKIKKQYNTKPHANNKATVLTPSPEDSLDKKREKEFENHSQQALEPPTKTSNVSIADSMKEIALTYFEPLPQIIPASMGSSEHRVDSLVILANQYYHQRNLIKTTEIIDGLVKEYPRAGYLRLILGNLYFQIGEYSISVQLFNSVVEEKSPFTEEARWNLLLSYMMLYRDYRSEYERLLERITTDSDHFKWESAVLLKQLDF